MGWSAWRVVSVLALGLAAVALAAGALDQRRRRLEARVPRPEVDRWEDEGGALPAES